MGNDFFDNAFEKTKTAIEVAYKKTGEVISTEKIKFNISSLKSKREKLFTKLGKNYFDNLSEADALSAENKAITDEIIELNAKIDEYNNQLNFARSNRICPACGSVIDEEAVFCSKCGAKVKFDSSEEN